MTSGYMAVKFISIDRIPFLAPTLDNADSIFALVITPGKVGNYLVITPGDNYLKVVDQDPASGSQ